MRAPLVVGVAWMVVGLAAGLQRPVPSGDGPLFITAALGAALVALAATRSPRRALAPFLLLCLAGGLLGMAVRADAERSCALWLPEDLPLEIRGTVVRAAAAAGPSSRSLRLRIDSVGVGGRWRECGAELAARWSGTGPVGPGTRVRGAGRWWTPPGARTTLRRPGALLLESLRAEDTAAGGGDTGGAVAGARVAGARASLGARARHAGVRRIEAVFPRHPELVASLLLAERDGLDRDVRDRYARAGLSHLLAISGLHVGLIAGVLLLVTGALRIRRSYAPAIAAGGTVAYVAMLGAPDSAARAALQIVLLLSARTLQRPSRTEALIAAAALILLAADPAAITRPGFQLSFAGVVGILALRPPLLRRLRRVARVRVAGKPAGRWAADGLATSVAATMATAPIVAWHFGRVAPIGIAANLAAIPLLTLAVPALALAVVVGWIWLPAGRFVAGGAELVLDALDATATAAAGVPFGTVAVIPSSAFVLTAAVVLGYIASVRLGRVRGEVRAGVWTAVAVLTLTVAPLRPTGDRVELHLIDVGQGDAIGIRSPAGRWLLVDAGVARDRWDAGARRVVPYLTARGVRRIEGLVITHPDGDHMGGAPAVLRSLRPRWAGGPGVVVGKAQYLSLLQEARGLGVPWIAARRGMEIEMDGLTLSVLYPDASEVDVADANDASVVIWLAYGEFTALLTGDAPGLVEDRLVRRLGGRLDADLLKVGHHGSNTSTTPALLAATGATVAVISAGRGNRYGHPHPEVLARLRQAGVRVYRTDRHGSVVIRAGADGAVRVGTERAVQEAWERSPR